MPITKHKIFKIKVSDDGKFRISKTIEKTINDFLSEPNNVYVNHSITTLTEDIEDYNNFKTICKFVLISIVYKDLDKTSMNVKGISKRTKETVHKEIESGNPIKEPNIITDFDKEILEIGTNDKEITNVS